MRASIVLYEHRNRRWRSCGVGGSSLQYVTKPDWVYVLGNLGYVMFSDFDYLKIAENLASLLVDHSERIADTYAKPPLLVERNICFFIIGIAMSDPQGSRTIPLPH
jgi:hypothetical protein